MAKIDVRLKNAAFYNAERIDVVVGEELDISLEEHEGDVAWVSHNDPVLEITELGHNAHVVANQTGKSRITIVVDNDEDTLTTVKVLRINVVDEIQLPASSLGLEAEIVPKQPGTEQ